MGILVFPGIKQEGLGFIGFTGGLGAMNTYR